MKVNELRIGNWVYNSISRMEYQVYPELFSQMFSAQKKRESMGVDPFDSIIKPIQITEEWLVKFGFFESNHNMINKKKCYEIESDINIILSKYANQFDVYTKYDPTGFRKGINKYNFITDNQGIKYVHQLQNLYFALTGNELILTK